ncbi:MAG: hypothetical protein QHJ74_08630, partial [Anaerolineae bacterium]|nr:hypothetical protein [Anaerolineae bacterium]
YHQVSEAEFGVSQHPSLTSVKFSVGRRVTHELLGESLMVSVETTERIEVEIRPARMVMAGVVAITTWKLLPIIVAAGGASELLRQAGAW